MLSRRLAALGVMLLMAVGPGGASSVSAQLLGPEVRAVRFVGNETFPRDSLIRAIATAQTECRSWLMSPFCALFGWGERPAELRERDVELDVERLERWYQIRGFREVQVESSTELGLEGAVEAGERLRWSTAGRPPSREDISAEEGDAEVATVSFTIDEGRPIIADDISFTTPDGFVTADLLNGLPISAGDRWSVLALDATRDTLIRRLRNRSYPYADVLRQARLPDKEPYRAEVTFNIEPGVSARYGDIRIEGLDRLDESTVLRTLPFRPGDPYEADQLVDGQVRLFGLEIVRNARVEADTVTMRIQSVPDSIVPLYIQVGEAEPYRVRTGVGFNSAECFNTEARWASRNFGGGGRVLQLRGRLANIFTPYVGYCESRIGQDEFGELTWLTAVDFTQPWIFSTRNSFNASVYAERQSVPDIFIWRALGLDLALVRALAPRTPLTLSYRPERSTLDAAEVLFCTSLLVCRREDIDVLSGPQRLAPVGLNLTRDMANSLLNPTQGYRFFVDLEHAARWTGSAYQYDRAVAEGTWYTRITGGGVVASRLRAGWVGRGRFYGADEVIEIVHPRRRFYAGGANSVRGFAQGRLGPRVLAVDNPARLIEESSDGGAGCAPDEIIDLTCDASTLNNRYIDPRPTGGTRVIEGNLEVRFELSRQFELVTFGDFGQAWGEDQVVDLRDLEFTPGLGARYLSPVGPIRVDVGYSFRGGEQLSVVTEQITPVLGECRTDQNPKGEDCLTVGGEPIPYRRTGELAVLPPVLYGDGESFWSRLQLHISIGQAF